jgi:peroxiredoxin
LRRWEELRPKFDSRGIQLVTVCSDTPEQIRKGKKKHGAQAVMLSDSDLKITRQYNLINEKNLSPKGISALSIPTTFLVDAEGIVRWIDQSEDYQIRSGPDRIMAAIEECL